MSKDFNLYSKFQLNKYLSHSKEPNDSSENLSFQENPSIYSQKYDEIIIQIFKE